MPPSEDDDYISKTTLLIGLDHNFKTLITSKLFELPIPTQWLLSQTLWLVTRYWQELLNQMTKYIKHCYLSQSLVKSTLRSNNINYIFLNFKTWKNNIAIYYIYYMLCIVIENFV